MCFEVGLKFKIRDVMWVIIVHALYVLKSARASFRAHLANNLQTMGFKPTFDDCDVWMRKNFLTLTQELNDTSGSVTGTNTTVIRPVPNPSNSAPTSGTPYYDYICTWFGDFLTVLHDATSKIWYIGYVYKLKAIDGSKEHWDPPKRYLRLTTGNMSCPTEPRPGILDLTPISRPKLILCIRDW